MKRAATLLLLTLIPFNGAYAEEHPTVIKLIDEKNQPLADYPFTIDDHEADYQTLDDGLFVLPESDVQHITVGSEMMAVKQGEVNALVVPNVLKNEEAPAKQKEDAAAEETTDGGSDADIHAVEDEKNEQSLTIHLVNEDFTTAEPVTVKLMKDDKVYAEQSSDAEGSVSFTGLTEDDYQVVYEDQTIDIKPGEEKYFLISKDKSSAQPIASRHVDSARTNHAVKKAPDTAKKAPQSDNNSHAKQEDIHKQATVSTKREIGSFINKKTDDQKTEHPQTNKTERQTVEQPKKDDTDKKSTTVKKQLPVEQPEVHPGDEDTVPSSPAGSPISTFKRSTSTSHSNYDSNNDSSNSNSTSTSSYGSSTSDDLPETGETSTFPLQAGIILFIVGSTLIYISRNKKISTP